MNIYFLFKAIALNFTLGILSPLFIIFIITIYINNKKNVYSTNVLKETWSDYIYTTFQSCMHGILIGFILSILINYLGISLCIKLDESSIGFFLVIILSLFLFDIKNVQFSYIGGISILWNMIFQWPEFNIDNMVILVSIFYIVNAIAILFYDEKDAMPILVKYKGKVSGAFVVNKILPVPVVFLILDIVLKSQTPSGSVDINSPLWWPLIRPDNIGLEYTLLCSLTCLPLLMHHSYMAIDKTPKAKSVESSIYLFLYSAILLFLNWIDNYYKFIQIITAVFIIFGYIYIVYIRNRKIDKNKLYLMPPKIGVKVLYTYEDGIGRLIGLLPGDIILRINEYDIMTYEGMEYAISQTLYDMVIKISRNNEEKKIHFKWTNCNEKEMNDFKILTVPKNDDCYVNININ